MECSYHVCDKDLFNSVTTVPTNVWHCYPFYIIQNKKNRDKKCEKPDHNPNGQQPKLLNSEDKNAMNQHEAARERQRLHFFDLYSSLHLEALLGRLNLFPSPPFFLFARNLSGSFFCSSPFGPGSYCR